MHAPQSTEAAVNESPRSLGWAGNIADIQAQSGASADRQWGLCAGRLSTLATPLSATQLSRKSDTFNQTLERFRHDPIPEL